MLRSRYPYYHFIAFALMTASLFLPYVSYDTYSGGFFTTKVPENFGVKESGIQNLEAFIPLVIILLTSGVMLINRSKGTAIVGVVFASLNLLFMPVLAGILVICFFCDKENYQLEIGYWLSLLSACFYLGMSIAHLIIVSREQKKTVATQVHEKKESDLLDDF